MSKDRKIILALGIIPLLFYGIGFYLDWAVSLWTLFGAIFAYGLYGAYKDSS